MDKEFASGSISFLKQTNGELIYVSGELTAPEPGRFFFVKQRAPGMGWPAFGVIEFPGSRKAYRLEPIGPSGAMELVERPLEDVICIGLPRPPELSTRHEPKAAPVYPGVPIDPGIPPYQDGIVSLQSLRGALPVIYLDFQGGYMDAWGGVRYERPAVNNDQIREVWQWVAEDFIPFNINVTTDLRVFENATPGSRQHVIITPTTFRGPAFAGIAYPNTFNSAYDLPCASFIIAGKCCADICSHEAGHTLGLSHTGVTRDGFSSDYYGGQGSGEASWGPLMGQPYSRNVTAWCQGEYRGANNHEDELWIITTQNNNVTYREDDTGDTLDGARYLELYPDLSASAEGIIERNTDTDAFQFTTAGGEVSLRVDPLSAGPNLAVQIALYDSSNNLLASCNPLESLWASLSTNLAAGTYTFRVSGAGRNDPFTDGFSRYGSLGYYSITGLVSNGRLPSRFSLSEHPTNGTPLGVVSPLQTNTHPHQFAIISGNKGDTFAIDGSGALVVLENGLLDYGGLLKGSPYRVQFELFVDILDSVDASLNEHNRRVVVTVTPAPTAAVVAQPLRLGSPGLLSDGTVVVHAQYADGSSVPADALARFEAQVSENLRDWNTLSNSLSCSNGFLVLTDSDAVNRPARFYRILERTSP